MTIQSINSSRTYLSTLSQSLLNSDLRRAFENVDINEIKRLVKLGANPNIKGSLRYDGGLKLALINMINNKNHFSKEFREAIEEGDLTKEGKAYKQVLLDFINRYDSIESKEQYAHVMFAYEQTKEKGLDFDVNGSILEVYLFELAVLINDPELIKTLLDAGAKFEPENWEIGSIYNAYPFTEKSLEILDLLIQHGYDLFDICAKDEGLYEILQQIRDNSVLYPEAALLRNYIKAYWDNPKRALSCINMIF